MPQSPSPRFGNVPRRRFQPDAPSSLRRSVLCALDGLRYAFATQRNVRIQLLVGAAAILLAALLRLPSHQLALIVVLVALVLFAELMNTSIESTLDHHAGSAFDPSVKLIKDMAAAAVLVASVGAVALGTTIFLPALALRFSR